MVRGSLVEETPPPRREEEQDIRADISHEDAFCCCCKKGGAQEMSARLRIGLSPPPSHRHQKRLTGEYRTPLTCCRNLGPRIHPQRFTLAMVLENHSWVVTFSEAGWIVLDKDFSNPTRTLG